MRAAIAGTLAAFALAVNAQEIGHPSKPHFEMWGKHRMIAYEDYYEHGTAVWESDEKNPAILVRVSGCDVGRGNMRMVLERGGRAVETNWSASRHFWEGAVSSDSRAAMVFCKGIGYESN